VVTALIVLGVIAFLAVDAYVLYRVFAGRGARMTSVRSRSPGRFG
jgi:hypothetical protein